MTSPKSPAPVAGSEPTNKDRAVRARAALLAYAAALGDGTRCDIESGLILNAVQDPVADCLHLVAEVENGGDSVSDETFIGAMNTSFANYESEVAEEAEKPAVTSPA